MRRLRGYVLLPVVAACAVPFPDHRPAPVGTDRPAPAFAAQPPGTRMTLRAILTHAGMELPMTVRIWRALPDSCRLVVTDDLGGTLLHLVDHRGTTTVLRRAAGLSADLAGSLHRDLACWLFAGRRPGDRTVVLADGAPAILHSAGPAHTLFWSSAADAAVDRIARGRADRLTARIEIHRQTAQPRRIHIENHEFGYRVDLEVREWQAADLPPAKFETAR